jgi:predicted permease
LLIGAGLLSRSLYLLQHVDLGVHSAGVFIARVMPVPNGYSNLDNAAYYPALLEELGAVPGIRSVGFARQFPQLTGEVRGQPIALVGSQASGAQAVLETVSPNFFETVGIPLLSGRSTTWADRRDSMQVAVVSESLARALAPNGDILGRHLRFGTDPANQDVAVVGVVGNTTLGNPRQADLPVFYRPALQTGRMANYPTVAIAADGDAAGVAASIREVFRRGGREYAHDIERLDDLLRRAPASERMTTTVAAAVAALAVLLVFVGVHGALAYSVSSRTREIGVRMAVGAAPSAVVKMLLREYTLVALAGVAIGLPSAFVAARLLRSMMFGIGVADPLTFVAASAFILALGLGATVIPTRRAAALDPAIALRAD